MSNWINLRMDTTGLERVERFEGGVEIRSWPSPYDVPEAARAVFDQPKKQLHIQFKYINEESLQRDVDEDGIIFGRGKNSRRLYEITVDMNKVEAIAKRTVDNLASFIVKEIKEFAFKDENSERQSNYTLVEQAISEEKESLLAAATPTQVAEVEPRVASGDIP